MGKRFYDQLVEDVDLARAQAADVFGGFRDAIAPAAGQEQAPLYSHPVSAAMAGRKMVEANRVPEPVADPQIDPRLAAYGGFDDFGEFFEPDDGPVSTRIMDDAPGEPMDVPAPTVMPAQQYDTDLPLPDPEPMDALPEPPFNDFDFPEPDLLPLVPEGQFGDGAIDSARGTMSFGGNDAPGLSTDQILDMGDDDSQFLDLASGQGYASFGNGPGMAIEGDQIIGANGQRREIADPFGFGTAERRRQSENDEIFAIARDPERLLDANLKAQFAAIDARRVPGESAADKKMLKINLAAQAEAVRAQRLREEREAQEKLLEPQRKAEAEAKKDRDDRAKKIRDIATKEIPTLQNIIDDTNSRTEAQVVEQLIERLQGAGYADDEIMSVLESIPRIAEHLPQAQGQGQPARRPPGLDKALERRSPQVLTAIKKLPTQMQSLVAASQRTDDEVMAILEQYGLTNGI